MSGADGAGAAGLGRPETDSVTASQGPSRQNSETASGQTPISELPTVDEVARECAKAFPHLVGLPLSQADGRKLRAEVIDEEHVEHLVYPDEPEEPEETGRPFLVDEVRERTARTWGAAVRELLEWYEEYRYKTLKFGKGRPDEPGRRVFTKPARNSWQPEYQRREFARLKALERQTVGYETCGECASYFCRRPADHETAREPGDFEEPVTAILTRTASGSPEGEHEPPVEHDRALVEAWEPVYHTIRNRLRSAGYSREEWVYHRQGEPHPGEGPNQAYGHEHTAIVLDVGGHEHGVDEVEELLRPAIDKHVEACEWADEAAHGEEAIEVKAAGEFDESLSSYVAKYLSIDDEADLFERPAEYIMWAAVQWATNTQKAVRSDNANWAIRADLCSQDYHDPEEPQVLRHGEEIRRSGKRGAEYECAECGSPWGVDQEHETLSGARLAADGGRPAAAPELHFDNRGMFVGHVDERPEPFVAEAVAAPEPVDEVAVDAVLREENEEADIVTCELDGPGSGPCGRLHCKKPEEHKTRSVSLHGSAREWAKASGTPPVVTGGEREPQWRLEAIVDSRYRRCLSCAEEYEAHEGETCPRCESEETEVYESLASPGHVDMRPLILPGEREPGRVDEAAEAFRRWADEVEADPSTLTVRVEGSRVYGEVEREGETLEAMRRIDVGRGPERRREPEERPERSPRGATSTEPSQRESVRSILSAVREHEPIPEEELVEAVDGAEEKVLHRVKKLIQSGELYPPAPGYLAIP